MGWLHDSRRRPPRGAGSCGIGTARFHGSDDDLGGDLQAQAVRIEDHVEVVRIGGIHPVHGAVELRAATVEVSGGAAGGAYRDAHPFRQT